MERLKTKDADLIRLAIKEYEPECLDRLKFLANELLNLWIQEETKVKTLEKQLKEAIADGNESQG